MANTNEKDSYNAKSPVFDGEKFDYWKDKIESFFLGYYADLWDIVTNGYEPPISVVGIAIPRSIMSDDQKHDIKNHHKARTIMLNTISYNEYEKITNSETTKEIFDSLKMTHEDNNQVKETKDMALIQKFQTLVVGLKVLDKGYIITDHVKKIIRSLPKKWRLMVTTLKLSKDLNNISLEELINSLRSHEIELEEDEPRKKRKSIALKSRSERRKVERNKAIQAEEEEEDDYENVDSDDDDELSLLSRRIKQLCRKINNNFRRPRQKGDRPDSTSRGRPNKEVTCYECKETGHYRNECPKLKINSSIKEGFKKNSFKAKKKGLMATWDDYESEASESDSEEEQANVALMDTTSGSSSKRESDSEEVFSDFSRSNLEACLSESLSLYQKLRHKFKNLKKIHEEIVEECDKLKKEVS
ncbi:uncharacterized protein LOC127094916 [Lathyrus oleraceus]|uniref:uncharacterized protein LOC127094916 n=1 Tax=Pisum sativum TaxID=3888 RepID=UPI0021CE5018|nr:uncharacterized protein LOC127094916 [Pisum sativum]